MNASRTRHHCVAPTPAPSQGDTPRLDTSPATERGSTPPGGSPAGTAADSGQRVSHDQNFKNLIIQYPRQALQFFAPAEAEGIDRRVKITPIRQEQLKPHLTDSFFELDVPLLLEWPDGRREALIFIVEHESDPGRFSITRLASYCLAVAEAMGTTRVIPVVIFMRDGRNGSGGAEGGRGRSAEAGRRTRGERGPMVRLEVSALSSDGAGIARTANGVASSV